MSKSKVGNEANKTSSVWNKINSAVKAKGGSEDALNILDKKEGSSLVNVIADILVTSELKTRNRFPVEVDYTKFPTITNLVKAGKYGYLDEDITAENFPIEGTGLVEYELIMVPVDPDMGYKAATKKIDKEGLVPCKIAPFLALGVKYSRLQKEYPILCLGSSLVASNGDRFFPALYWWLDNSYLDLHRFGFDDCRVPAVCK